ncbi:MULTISPECIES: sensor histidine kinase [Nostocales]|uniref:histidine kinase n=3 Tax=Nostocales TaxID=1161 RepID=A0A0C1MZF2_9CYAN|nr:HAMP domain-containing sensor histidine kinase [Tolypothrix bouteillei]KAF3891164.1 HAMP domain-containing histidine kinase [Tolypothrix bouteillei VB521301]
MLAGLSSLVIVSKLFSFHIFDLHLQRLEGRGFDIGKIRYELVEEFQETSMWGAWWLFLTSVTVASGMSYVIAKHILKPLVEMEKITHELGQGELTARVPETEIPELNRLAISFNRMASHLEGVEQRRRELVGDLTHELRTPLTILEGYLEGLADGTIEPSAEVFQRLTRETTRLHRLVNDTQELSKAEAGYLPIHLQVFDIHPLLRSLIQRFSDQLLEEGPELRLECPPNPPLVCADPERVEQILVNLLGNAVRYTLQGSITVRVWSEPSKLWIAVIDTGHGLKAEDLPFVFNRFWRSERSRIRHPAGTGMGLAISQRLVQLQQGEIQVESELNKGTTFRFSLPLA